MAKVTFYCELIVVIDYSGTLPSVEAIQGYDNFAAK